MSGVRSFAILGNDGLVHLRLSGHSEDHFRHRLAMREETMVECRVYVLPQAFVLLGDPTMHVTCMSCIAVMSGGAP